MLKADMKIIEAVRAAKRLAAPGLPISLSLWGQEDGGVSL